MIKSHRGPQFLALSLLIGGLAMPAGAQSPVVQATVDEEPVGNLAEIMRAFLYPASNLLFEVQSADPGDPPAESAGGALFSGLYSGWQAVEQAAIALVEIEEVTLRPRLCENGRSAPVEREDYRRMARRTTTVGREILEAARQRDRDAVVGLTDRLVASCEDCHLSYMRWDDRCRPEDGASSER